jgi:plasmid stabilization system protein ParE
MNVRKTDDFIADVERQFEWYGVNAGWNVADLYLDAVEATCHLLGRQPHLGPSGGFAHPRLREWRFDA